MNMFIPEEDSFFMSKDLYYNDWQSKENNTSFNLLTIDFNVENLGDIWQRPIWSCTDVGSTVTRGRLCFLQNLSFNTKTYWIRYERAYIAFLCFN